MSRVLSDLIGGKDQCGVVPPAPEEEEGDVDTADFDINFSLSIFHNDYK